MLNSTPVIRSVRGGAESVQVQDQLEDDHPQKVREAGALCAPPASLLVR
jgi:hypothetical protein